MVIVWAWLYSELHHYDYNTGTHLNGNPGIQLCLKWSCTHQKEAPYTN